MAPMLTVFYPFSKHIFVIFLFVIAVVSIRDRQYTKISKRKRSYFAVVISHCIIMLRNFFNYILSLTIIYFLISSVPLLCDVFTAFSAGWLGLKLAGWLMTITRRYILYTRISPKDKAVLITGEIFILIFKYFQCVLLIKTIINMFYVFAFIKGQ